MKKELLSSALALSLSLPFSAWSNEHAAPSEAGPAVHGHGHSHPPSHVDQAIQDELNSMNEAKLKGLAAYLRAQLKGESERDALRKSKMTLQAIEQLTFLSARYYPARARALEIEKELAHLRAQPTTDASTAKPHSAQARALEQKLSAHERFRTQFFQQIKAESRRLIDKYEPTFVALVNEQKEKDRQRLSEAIALVQKSFDETLLPRLTTYLVARTHQKSQTEALAAAKLDEKQVLGLSHLVSEYSRQKATALRAAQELPQAQKRLADAKVQKKSTSFEERLIQHYEAELAEFEKFQKDFAQRNGEKLQEAIETNYESLMAAYQKEAALMTAADEE